MASAERTLLELCAFLGQRLAPLQIPPGRRPQLSVACFSIALEHLRAIAVLLDARLYASAFVLLRPLFESTVKGAWLAHRASEQFLEKHASGSELEAISTLLDGLQKSSLPVPVVDLLSGIKNRNWKLLSSFSHSGFAQVKRWVSPNGVEPQYAQAVIEEAANFAGVLGVVASLELARVSGDTSAVEELHAMLPRVSQSGT